jgi:hypothetical protein
MYGGIDLGSLLTRVANPGKAVPPAAQTAGTTAPTAQTLSPLDALMQTPGYQFTLQQGLQAGQNASTLAGGVSGNTLEALTKYASGLAEGTWQNQVTNLQNLVNTGEGAATNTAANIGTAATNLGNIAMTQGTNLANLSMAQSGQLTGLANTALNNFTLGNILSGSGVGGMGWGSPLGAILGGFGNMGMGQYGGD